MIPLTFILDLPYRYVFYVDERKYKVIYIYLLHTSQLQQPFRRRYKQHMSRSVFWIIACVSNTLSAIADVISKIKGAFNWAGLCVLGTPPLTIGVFPYPNFKNVFISILNLIVFLIWVALIFGNICSLLFHYFHFWIIRKISCILNLHKSPGWILSEGISSVGLETLPSAAAFTGVPERTVLMLLNRCLMYLGKTSKQRERNN